MCSSLLAEPQYGFLSYSTTNIGDDIQALAARNLLSKNSIGFDRDYLRNYEFSKPIKTLINGWLIHNKSAWLREGLPPDSNWPPHEAMQPLITSVHFTGSFLEEAFKPENIEYLKNHGPIGARDYFTLDELQKRNIPSYFSGCLTLTLDNPYNQRNENIYVVDLDEEVVNFIKSKTKSPVIKITHGFFINNFSIDQRLKFADKLLDKYRKAKCVITSRLHAAMPCLAFKTPVLLVVGSVDDPRFRGLGCLTHNCSKNQLINEEYIYNFSNPPSNSQDYLKIRNNLINIVKEWKSNN